MATVIHIMADGKICNDITAYMKNKELPKNAELIIFNMMKEGAKKNDP